MTENLQETIVHAPGGGTAKRTLFGYETTEHPSLDKVQNAISAFCAAIAAIAVALITVLTVTEVFTRTIANKPLGWSVGFVEQYLMMAIAFFGTVTAYRAGAHVAVFTIFERLPNLARKLLLILTYLILLITLGFLTYSGAAAAQFAFSINDAPPPGMAELPWPTWWWKAIIPVACSLGFIVVAIDLVRELIAPLSTVATDYEPGDSLEGH